MQQHNYIQPPTEKPPLDHFLGPEEDQRLVKEVSTKFLRPAVRFDGQKIGVYRRVHIRYVVPNHHFHGRREILRLLPEGPIRFYLQAIRTPYFKRYVKRFGTIRPGLWSIHRYRRLFKSIRRHGLRSDPNNPLSVPWLFASKECIYRLDGHHRASILRLLGHETVEVLLFTPKDLKELDNIPDSVREAVARLHEPEVDLSKDPRDGNRETAQAPR